MQSYMRSENIKGSSRVLKRSSERIKEVTWHVRSAATFSFAKVFNITNSFKKRKMHKKILAQCVRRGKDGTEVNIKPVCVCVCVCLLGTAGLQWHWTWADNLFTVCSGELINKCWVISARSNYPCRWQGECVSTPLHPRPCPEGFELVRKHTHTHTRTDMHRCTSTQ